MISSLDLLVKKFSDVLLFQEGKSVATVSLYTREAHRLNTFMTKQGLLLQNLDRKHIEQFLLSRQVGLASRAKILSAVKRYVFYLQSQEIINTDPMRHIKRVKVRASLHQPLATAQIDDILAKCPLESPLGLRDRTLYELIYSAGLRVSEAVALDIGDILFEQGLLKVLGKGQKPRLIPLGDTAMSWLQRYLTEVRLLKKTSQRALFLNAQGTRLGRQGMWKNLQKLREKPTSSLKTHALRHAFASHLLEGGADLRVVQELLGHNSITTTEIYTHTATVSLQNAHKTYHPRAQQEG
jgi:integrase/recombinase XerD